MSLSGPQSRSGHGGGEQKNIPIIAPDGRIILLLLSLAPQPSRPWPPPQNPTEFLEGFSTIFFLRGRVVSPTPNPHPGGPGLCIYIPQRITNINFKNNYNRGIADCSEFLYVT
jgi:hypothetical protein